jgi:hypothetical protein
VSWEAPDPRRRWNTAAGAVAVILLMIAAVAVVRWRGGGAAELAVDQVTTDPAGTDLDGTVDGDGLLRAPLEPAQTPAGGAGPLLPEAPPLTLIIADFSSRLQLIDITTGARRTVHVFVDGTRQRPDGLQIVGDSVIFDAAGRVLRLLEGDEGAPQLLARDHRSIPTTDTSSVWVYDQLTSNITGVALRVGFDGTVLDRIGLPALAHPLAGTGDGLIVRAPGTISHIDLDGHSTLIARGQALASDGTRVARLDCLRDLSCAVVIGTVDAPDGVRVALPEGDVPTGLYDVPQARFSPDGRLLALPVHRELGLQRLEQSSVVVIDVALGTEVDRLPGSPLTAPGTPFAWSPDSEWLAVSTGTGMRMWSAASGRARKLDLQLPPTYAITAR